MGNANTFGYVQPANGLASPSQRGTAAHLRQLDDNSGRQILTSSDRNLVNKVIHDPNMNHRPGFDAQLNQLRNQHFPPQR